MKSTITRTILDAIGKCFGCSYDYRIEILEALAMGGSIDQVELINHLIKTKSANVNVLSQNIAALVKDGYIKNKSGVLKANDQTAILCGKLKTRRASRILCGIAIPIICCIITAVL